MFIIQNKAQEHLAMILNIKSQSN